jgi:hypothetical protein
MGTALMTACRATLLRCMLVLVLVLLLLLGV